MTCLQVGSIKDFALGIFDGPHATPKEADEGPVFLGIKNVTPRGMLDLSEIRHVSEEEFPKWTKRVLPRENDIVFSYEATLHLYALIPEGFRGCLGRRMALVRPDPGKADPRFLHYYFLAPAWRAVVEANVINGATVDRVPLTKFPSFEVRLPALDVQKRIASILSAYDDLIENNRRRIQLLEQAARLLYKEWFVYLRFPGHEHVKIKDGVPEGWQRRTLTELAESVSYGLTASATEDNGGPRFLRITDIVPPELNWDDVPFCQATDEEIKRNSLEVGDVVVARTGATVGYAKRISLLPSAAVYASYLVRFRFPSGALSVIAGIFMESDAYKEYVINHAGGAAQPNANARVLGSALLSIPPRTVQDQFSSFVEHWIAQRDTLLRQNSRLAKARDLLLPRLMGGELTA